MWGTKSAAQFSTTIDLTQVRGTQNTAQSTTSNTVVRHKGTILSSSTDTDERHTEYWSKYYRSNTG